MRGIKSDCLFNSSVHLILQIQDAIFYRSYMAHQANQVNIFVLSIFFFASLVQFIVINLSNSDATAYTYIAVIPAAVIFSYGIDYRDRRRYKVSNWLKDEAEEDKPHSKVTEREYSFVVIREFASEVEAMKVIQYTSRSSLESDRIKSMVEALFKAAIQNFRSSALLRIQYRYIKK